MFQEEFGKYFESPAKTLQNWEWIVSIIMIRRAENVCRE